MGSNFTIASREGPIKSGETSFVMLLNALVSKRDRAFLYLPRLNRTVPEQVSHRTVPSGLIFSHLLP